MLCWAATLSGCGRNDGAKTFEFLKAEQAILENTQKELKESPIPQPPIPPVLSEDASKRERVEAKKAYLKAEEAYLAALIGCCQQAERLLNNAQTDISRLDSSGVGEDGITLTEDYERNLGDCVQGCVELKAIATLYQENLLENKGQELLGAAFKAVVAMAMASETAGLSVGLEAFGKGILADVEQDNERGQKLKVHSARFQAIIAAREHDTAEMVTDRSELVTSYRAKYPEYQWDSILPAPEENKH
jgi:hypothetical protein